MLANAVEQTTTDTTSPYTMSTVTGMASWAAVPADVLCPYEIESGNDKEWGFGSHDGAGEFTVDNITATLKSGTYDNTSPTAITKSGTSTIRLAASADVVAGSEVALHSTDVTGIKSPHIVRDGGTVGTQTNTYCFTHYEVTIPREYSSASIRITAATGGSETMRMGIYSVGNDAEPDILLAESDAAELINATGTLTFTFTAPVFLNKGPVRIAWISQGSATIVGGVTDRVGPCGFGSVATDNLINWLKANSTDTFPSGMPDPFSYTGTMLAQTGSPHSFTLN
jgi:hypothetical protein